eukprot:SAG25_NODE_4648_length_775_cov_1.306213_1_plen_124_part_01
MGGSEQPGSPVAEPPPPPSSEDPAVRRPVRRRKPAAAAAATPGSARPGRLPRWLATPLRGIGPGPGGEPLVQVRRLASPPHRAPRSPDEVPLGLPIRPRVSPLPPQQQQQQQPQPQPQPQEEDY